MRLRKNSAPYQLLKYLALGSGILILSMIAPYGMAQATKTALSAYIRKRRFQRNRFARDLKKLQQKELIDYQELNDGKIKISLGQQGKEKILMYKINEIKLKMPKRWDKKWRLVMFDIPHQCKNARDAFRRKLLNLKFYPIQKSVFITPYPCEDEIDFIASVFDIRRYLLIMHVNYFEGEKKLKHYFQLY